MRMIDIPDRRQTGCILNLISRSGRRAGDPWNVSDDTRAAE
jgi:hypothetical protein